MDYLTKWPEVFQAKDQTSLTIAKVLVEFITLHGVPNQLLSDQGTSFLSKKQKRSIPLLITTKVMDSSKDLIVL